MVVNQSWNLLKQDKEIMWFPVLSGVVTIIRVVIFSAAMFFIVLAGDLVNIGNMGSLANENIGYVMMFAFYLLTFFIVDFFTVGIYTIANGRFNGNDLSFQDGIRGAMENVGKIFVWSLISATVGLILHIMSERSKLLGKIVAMVLGAVWGILTYFSLPVLVIGKTSIIDSFKQSAAMIRKTWGEVIIINFGVGTFFSLLFLVGVLLSLGMIVLVPTLSVLIGVGILLVLYSIALTIISQSLGAIFKLALYEYAATGRIPEGFSPELVQGAIRTR